MTGKQFFYILFVSHGIALAKHIVKQDKGILFQSKKKIRTTLLYWQLVEENKYKIINLN